MADDHFDAPHGPRAILLHIAAQPGASPAFKAALERQGLDVDRRVREFPRSRAGGAPPLDMEGLLKFSSPLTPSEAAQTILEALRLPADADLAQAIADEIKENRVRYGAWQREASRFSGVAPSGLGPDPFTFHTAQQIVETARDRGDDRVAYLNSNIGKARRKIAEGMRKAVSVHAGLDAISAALSRGDGSAPVKAEEARALVQDLRIIAADVEAYVKLVQDEADTGPEAA